MNRYKLAVAAWVEDDLMNRIRNYCQRRKITLTRFVIEACIIKLKREEKRKTTRKR